MAERMQISVVGNCQAQMIEGLFQAAGKNIVVRRIPPVFELRECDEENVMKNLNGSSQIFSQRLSEEYHIKWLRPSALKARFGGRVSIWPNIYFDGYFPDVQYIYLPRFGKLEGPLHDYHILRFFNAFKAHSSVETTVSLFLEECNEVDTNSFERSLEQLRQREAESDIKISDYIERNAGIRKLFFTPNHPCNELLIEMAQRMAIEAKIEFDAEAAMNFQYSLNRIEIPVFPGVQRSLDSVLSPMPLSFRGVAVVAANEDRVLVGDQKEHNLKGLISEFFRVYAAIAERS